MAVVIAMKETLLLLPMHRNIRGIEVRNQAPGRFLMASHELVKEQLVQVARHGAILLLLKATQGSRARECFRALETELERGIEA